MMLLCDALPDYEMCNWKKKLEMVGKLKKKKKKKKKKHASYVISRSNENFHKL